MTVTNDEVEIKKAEDEKALDDEAKLEALRASLKTYGGRKWAWDMLIDCHFFRVVFTGNSTTFFNDGMRAVGLQLFNDIMKADPGAFATMLREFYNG